MEENYDVPVSQARYRIIRRLYLSLEELRHGMAPVPEDTTTWDLRQ